MTEDPLYERFTRWLQEQASPEEGSAWNAMLADPAREMEIRSLLERCWEEAPPLHTLDDTTAGEIFHRVLSARPGRVTRSLPASRQIIRWRRLTAAAVILIIAAGAWFWQREHARMNIPPSPPVSLQNDALPGSNRATLTLSNGQQLVLAGAAQDTVLTEGAAIVASSNGRLAYNTGSAPATLLAYNTLTTPRGGQYQLTLPDGTKVWLNAASSITYPTAFTDKERSVNITGEVYFEVTKDRSRPFHVKVNDMEVDVLGTNFNVNAYHDEGGTRTTLLEGSVKINAAQTAVTLKPGQQAHIISPLGKENLKVINDADLDEVMAWKNGYFKFNDADIRTVMQQIERWYDLQVVYEGALPKDHFGGKLPRDANASEVLKTLEQTQVHFRIEGKKLIVMP